MPFSLTLADQDALSNVDISIVGSGTNIDAETLSVIGSEQGIKLNKSNLMFPPVVTKDSKQGAWGVEEQDSGSYEELKYYTNAKSRKLAIDFEWVCGTSIVTGDEGSTTMDPDSIHNIISGIKSYFYRAYFGEQGKQLYPVVYIYKLYNIIDGTKQDNLPATFRMMDVNVKYSKELVKVSEKWFPLHTKVSINLESASQLKPIKTNGDNGGESIMQFTNLPKQPNFKWY